VSGRILVSTHDLQRAGRLRDAFRDEGYTVELVTPAEDLGARDDVVLLVLTLPGPGETGQHLLAEGQRLEVPVVGFGPGGLPGLAEVFPQGASVDEVVLVSRRLLERRRLQEVTGIVGETDAMREVLERVVQFAPVASTVLITGESGTGKELVARGIHALSPRKHASFIAVNVAALPDTLLESELFGHEKGAFTGAIDSRRGLFELADRGTIFLDEIGEMPLATQTKLLRVLEQREFLRVGGEKPISVNVRIVAATNQDLRHLVTLREFRKDLYYRLNVLHIALPPLRERTDDIPLLARRFSREVAERLDRPFEGIGDEAMEILKQHRWPGNVRELRNLVESMVVLAPGRKIRPEDIPDEIRRGGGGELLPARLSRGEPRGEAARPEGEPGVRPQLEFVFRTLVDLRMDMDELRREFDAYRENAPAVGGGDVAYLPGRGPAGEGRSPTDLEGVEVVDVAPSADDGGRWEAAPEPGGEAPPPDEGSGVVVYRPGMTMDDLEREAIAAALDEVDGNRRKAAELLGIGERTLYRKIKKYDLEG
jgi:DNA-binding NtrC family response regulator